MAVGAGSYITAVGGGILTLVILVVLRRVQERLDLKETVEKRDLPTND